MQPLIGEYELIISCKGDHDFPRIKAVRLLFSDEMQQQTRIIWEGTFSSIMTKKDSSIDHIYQILPLSTINNHFLTVTLHKNQQSKYFM